MASRAGPIPGIDAYSDAAASPAEDVSTHTVSNVMAGEASVVDRHERERLARIEELNSAPLVLGNGLWSDAGLDSSRTLRSLAIEMVNGSVAVSEQTLKAALAQLLHQDDHHSRQIHEQQDTIDAIKRELSLLKDRSADRSARLEPGQIRTLMSMTSTFAGGSNEDFENWAKRFENACKMLDLKTVDYVKCAEMRLEEKAAQRWQQVCDNELQPGENPGWQQFLDWMTPMFARADKEAKAVAAWEDLALKSRTVRGLSTYGREVLETYTEMGKKKPNSENAWSKFKQGLPASYSNMVTMAETVHKDDEVWKGNLAGRIGAATTMLHAMLNDTVTPKKGAGSEDVGMKRGADGAGLDDEPADPKRKQKAAKDVERDLSDEDFESLSRSHVAFTDPNEKKPFSKELMKACQSRGLCLFCLAFGHRMFDCPKLKADAPRYERLLIAFHQRKKKQPGKTR